VSLGGDGPEFADALWGLLEDEPDLFVHTRVFPAWHWDGELPGMPIDWAVRSRRYSRADVYTVATSNAVAQAKRRWRGRRRHRNTRDSLRNRLYERLVRRERGKRLARLLG
jgi:hypothetical protein